MKVVESFMLQSKMNKEIAKYPCVINEEECWPANVCGLTVQTPSDGSILGRVPQCDREMVRKAVESAKEAFQEWRYVPSEKRAQLLRSLSVKMMEQKDVLATLLSREAGKPIGQAMSEVESSAHLVEYFSQEALRMKGELPSRGFPSERVLVAREPVGVVGAITPFNYPLSTLACKLGAALAAGCTVVAKPDEHTPLSTLMVARLFRELGFQPGLFNVITGDGSGAGSLLVNHPDVRLITFTGSVETGQQILSESAPYVRKVILELGGNCPAVICKDSPWEKDLAGIVKQSFKNSGQYCYRINRIYVEEDIFKEFVTAFTEASRKLKLGLPADPATDLGPLNNEKILEKVQKHISDALSKGARIESGGARIMDPPLDKGIYFPPTIMTNMTQDMLVMKEETFGPVVGIMPFQDVDRGVELANESPYGLAAYLYISDIGKALELADRLEAGSVWINKIHQAYFSVPFGGYKMSGLGREKSTYGIKEFQELKATYLCLE